ncbi:uncharacterized protein TRAVEDRAFT_50446 [Trametes versicolor FP-101664 SS1]|uniref:uncharacterized protein n=1 Tax=Trametes versicolor (strain FP-101664) TaxID=717944 RepID=UPI000462338B|nr:uncharacterized protein TRAVEDRAFT_50446 [Trametes versicolor FP-101664 SS1]EIW55957.1 hypothetical protein TRAVEDRAFT_50446 [Trametes versicolor FP-101664 SS1]
MSSTESFDICDYVNIEMFEEDVPEDLEETVEASQTSGQDIWSHTLLATDVLHVDRSLLSQRETVIQRAVDAHLQATMPYDGIFFQDATNAPQAAHGREATPTARGNVTQDEKENASHDAGAHGEPAEVNCSQEARQESVPRDMTHSSLKRKRDVEEEEDKENLPVDSDLDEDTHEDIDDEYIPSSPLPSPPSKRVKIEEDPEEEEEEEEEVEEAPTPPAAGSSNAEPRALCGVNDGRGRCPHELTKNYDIDWKHLTVSHDRSVAGKWPCTFPRCGKIYAHKCDRTKHIVTVHWKPYGIKEDGPRELDARKRDEAMKRRRHGVVSADTKSYS